MGDVHSIQATGVNKYGLNQTGYPYDHIAMNLQFTSGSIGTIYSVSSALSLKPWERVEIYGQRSWLAVEDQHKLILYDCETGPAKMWEPVIPNTLLFDEEFGGFVGLLDNFLQCIRGHEVPKVTGWDGHKAYELAVASHLSIRTGERMTLPLDPNSADRECKEWLNS